MAAALTPVLSELIAETGQDAMQQVGGEASQFNAYTDSIQTFFTKRTERIAKEVNQETERQLRAALAEGVTAGETLYEIRARLEQVFGADATARADRMAQYQVNRLMSYSDIQAWDQSGVVEGKEWFTARDERVCPGCNSMHGTVIGLHELFFNKGDTLTVDRGEDKSPYKLDLNYESISSCPLHNKCRCVLLPVMKQAQ
jgi:SPP1 gp7 family putative phage head morphogenesis protein